MAVNINGDTGIDKITDGSVVADDLASTLDLTGKTITLATDAAVVSKLSTASGSAPSYSARAWVNFNGSGTVAIRSSGNVSSITDNGTGNFTINFTTAMPDANYSVSGVMNVSANTVVGSISIYPSSTPTTSSVQIHVAQVNAASFAVRDAQYNYVNVFR